MIKTCPELDLPWKRKIHVYRTTPNSFCANTCPSSKPFHFKCSKEIMPDIEYSFMENGQSTPICTVYSMNGIDDEHNKACIKKVRNFLLDHESQNSKLIYITHGWQDRGGWLSNLRYRLQERYRNEYVVVAAIYWPTGADASKSQTFSLSSRSEKVSPYCKSGACQFMLCCISPVLTIAGIDYGTPAVNTWPVGNVVAYVHDEIVGATMGMTKDINTLTYCIGLSLGAHVCGFFGKMTRALNNNKPIYKIIGLDPAGPMFEYPDHDPELRLNRNHAEIVEIFHTNTILLGFEDAIGHIDLYINGGGLQPNCPKYKAPFVPHECSHTFGIRLLDHILRNETLPCYAKWKCNTRRGADLLNIKQEDTDQLESANCFQKPEERFEIGNLDETSKNQFGSFWIQIDETSETCKFNH